MTEYGKLRLLDLIERMDIRQRRLFACDCVEHIFSLQIFIQKYLKSEIDLDWVRDMISAARQFATGKLPYSEVQKIRVTPHFYRHSEPLAPRVATATECAAWAPEPPDFWPPHKAAGEWEGVEVAQVASREIQWVVSIATFRENGLEAAKQAEEAELNWQRQRAIWYLEGEEIE